MPFQSVNVLPVLPKPHNGLPRGPQLSAPEDKEMKKKLRNRESALAARERKKQKMLGTYKCRFLSLKLKYDKNV